MNKVKVLQFDKRSILLWIILFGLVSSFLLYTYFLNATILHIVERRSVEQNITDTNIHISELEFVYMELSTEITPALAESLGYIEPNQVIFAQGKVHTGFAKLGE